MTTRGVDSVPRGTLWVDLALTSDVGRERSENQDRVLAWDPSSGGQVLYGRMEPRPADGLVLGVCDGMGGQGGGQVASEVTADAILAHARDLPERYRTEPNGASEWLCDGIRAANSAVRERQTESTELATMGSTATVCALVADRVAWSHVGDSRAYHVRDGVLRQLTTDHSIVGRLVAQGQLSAREANMHVDRNVLTQAVGAVPELNLDHGSVPVRAGDTLMMCSDGLYDTTSEDEIGAVLCEEAPAWDRCERLVTAANANGGRDNISVIVAQLYDQEAP